jgi:hypothetical protein
MNAENTEIEEAISALYGIDGVVAIGIGGSRGLGMASAESDFDLVLFRNEGKPIDAGVVAEALRPYVGDSAISTAAGLVQSVVGTRRLEVFQKDLRHIKNEIELARAGKFRWILKSLFPHGWLSTTLISHLIHLEVCRDRDAALAQCRDLATPMPAALVLALIKTFMTQASITLTHARKIHRHEDLQHLVSLASGFVFYLNIVLFALNRQYPVLEKGGTRLIESFRRKPEDYGSRVERLLVEAATFKTDAVIGEMTRLMGEVRQIFKPAREEGRVS